tara:strand:- start:768 stop:1391 length:624 start_codon:yes stop_codon:yes gene_type:complete
MLISEYFTFSYNNKAKTGQTCPKGVYYSRISNIFTYVNIMALSALRESFTGKAAAALVAGTALFSAASLPAANDAHAGEPQTATATQPELTDEKARPSHMMREMRHYSEKPDTKGIGIYINLQANAAGKGDLLGQRLVQILAAQNPPIPAQYRFNQSLGTATDITFYVKGVGFPVNMGELKTELGGVFAHHRGAWLPGQVSLSTQPQ